MRQSCPTSLLEASVENLFVRGLSITCLGDRSLGICIVSRLVRRCIIGITVIAVEFFQPKRPHVVAGRVGSIIGIRGLASAQRLTPVLPFSCRCFTSLAQCHRSSTVPCRFLGCLSLVRLLSVVSSRSTLEAMPEGSWASSLSAVQA